MACYYLVISSTHLSNGHFRSIKGVFRGPLCRSAGGESPDYAEKEKAIAKALEDLKANFYCELCDKQYHKHQEFDNHINSYDHAHKQRLKELKQREFARNVASKSWKDERKQERALKRLHRLAELRQRSDCGPGSGPKFRTTTVTARDQYAQRIPSERDCRSSSRPLCPVPSGASAAVTRCPLGLPLHREPPHGRKKQSATGRDHSSRRLGISFCFSRKAQLKLESCASVFSDGAEEASGDRRAFQRLRGRRSSEAFPFRTPSPGDGAGKGAHRADDDRKRITSANRQDSPVVASPASPECPDMVYQLRELGQRPISEVEYKGSHRSKRNSSRGTCVPDGPAEVEAVPHPRAAIVAQEPLRSPGSAAMARSCENTKVNDSRKYVTEDCAPGQRRIVADGDLNKNQVSFVNVLSKDGEAMLKWPKELLCYTKSEPYVSYSCNPLYFTFHRSRSKPNGNESTREAEPDHSNGDEVTDNAEGKNATFHFQSHPENKPGVSKPKRAKHHKARKTQCLKSDAVGRVGAACMQNANSQMECLARFEGPQAEASQNKCERAKRSRLGKRQRSFKEETSDQSDTAERSLRSLVRSLSVSSSKKKKHQTVNSEEQSLGGGPFPGPVRFSMKSSRFKCHRITSHRNRVNKKHRPGGFLSDLSSDSEEPPYLSGKYSSPPRSSHDLSPKRWSYSREDNGMARTWSGSSGSDTSSNLARGCRRSADTHACHSMRFLWEGCSWDTDLGQSVCNNGKMDWKMRTRGGQSPSSWSSGSTSDLSRDNRIEPHLHRIVRKRARSFDDPQVTYVDVKSSHGKSSSVTRDEPSFAKLSLFQNVKIPHDLRGNSSALSVITKDQLIAPNVSATNQSVDKPANDKNSVRKKVNGVLSLPLIGKFPAVRRRAKRGAVSTAKSTVSQSQPESKESPGTASRVQNQLLAPSGPGICTDPSQHNLESGVARTEGQLGNQVALSRELLSRSPVSSNTPTRTHQKKLIAPGLNASCCQGHASSEPAANSSMSCVPLPEPGRPLKCISPPLSEQPITFSPDEIDKYRQLQLQAQQHVQQQQQQLLRKQARALPEALGEIPDPGPPPAFHPTPVPPPSPIPTLPHALLPHRTLAAFTSSLAPRPPAGLHPLVQPRLAAVPLPAVGPALFPALLPGPPLQLVPASAFHPAHVALHPIPHGPLLPALLGPTPLAAAAASALHLHPLLQPLFPGQNLQPHPGPTA